MPINIIAAIAVKRIMERDKLPGTIMLWPGVAEEQLATKAWFVRDGVFKDVDVVLFAHVGNNLGVSWGEGGGNGMVSVEYTFEGETAHSAGAPWRGRSALDAVELMSIGMAVSPRAPAPVAAHRTRSSPTAAISRTSCRATPASGATSAKPTSRTSRRCGTSATRWPRARR